MTKPLRDKVFHTDRKALREPQALSPKWQIAGNHRNVIWTEAVQEDIDKASPALRDTYFRILRELADAREFFAVPLHPSRALFSEAMAKILGSFVFFYRRGSDIEVFHVEIGDGWAEKSPPIRLSEIGEGSISKRRIESTLNRLPRARKL